MSLPRILTDVTDTFNRMGVFYAIMALVMLLAVTYSGIQREELRYEMESIREQALECGCARYHPRTAGFEFTCGKED
jgi:hypothetical protein